MPEPSGPTSSMMRFGQSGQLSISASAGFIGRPFQKIVAGQALRMRQRKGKLTGLNADCHANLQAGILQAQYMI